jgi:transcriptional regulator with XRE-family HTH domain
MASAVPSAYDRVVERRRAVALARHFREAERLSTAQIADRLGRSPATIKAYFYDPSDANKKTFRIAPRATAGVDATRAVYGAPGARAKQTRDRSATNGWAAEPRLYLGSA